MPNSVENAILISYYQSQQRYERLAEEIQRLFADPAFPKDGIYTVKYRLKNTERLIEKVQDLNKKFKRTKRVTVSNYQEYINDLLGMRIVCLRKADVEKVGRYLESLRDEGKLAFLKKPQKKSPPFLWIQNPHEKLRTKDLQYSGYSSIHYVVRLGRTFKPSNELSQLRTEIQVRTILEEAWGEIDHKYRYEITRRGTSIPEAVDRGFRSFSAYLQAAAVQAEYLARDAEALIAAKPPKKRKARRKKITPPSTPAPNASSPAAVVSGPTYHTIESVLEKTFGFPPTQRMIAYVERRMHDNGYYSNLGQILQNKYLTDGSLETFRSIYRTVLKREPFKDASERDIDVLNALNFCIFRLIQSERVATENLRSILYGRTQRKFVNLLDFDSTS